MPAESTRPAAGMGEQLRLTIPADAQAVRLALQAASDSLLQSGLTTDARGTAEIVIAEALNNIVEHAYASTEGEIELSLIYENGKLTVLVTDGGTAMPGGRMPEGLMPEPDPVDPPEGGFGWFMIRSLSQDLRYFRSEGRNHLFFRLDADPEQKQSA